LRSNELNLSQADPMMATHFLDIEANRKARKWTRTELFGRALWECFRGPLFYYTPRPFWAWRRAVLRIFGARVGRNVRVHPTARIEIPWNLEIGVNACLGDGVIAYSLGSIVIGSNVTISQYVHLCAGTHDYSLPDMPLLKKSICIEAGVWVCADAFIGPGVTVGESAVVAARAVVVKDVPPGTIVAGNPARVLGPRKFQSCLQANIL
jgi:putative colanic acid biosynthesis acetyltransferase WcaF